MDSFEMVIFLLGIGYTFKFLFKWYHSIFKAWLPNYNRRRRIIFGFLPPLSFFIFYYVLHVLASFDVANDVIYLMMYMCLGFYWIHLTLWLMARFWDLSWLDDVMHSNNRAAIWPVGAGFIGSTLIYAGANIGDGPGWWCVVFAGGLGMAVWILLGIVIHKVTWAIERITVERDVACGIRIGSYLLASAIILGRASGGDWTSFFMTVIEFMVGWPVLILALMVTVVEIVAGRKYEGKNVAQEDFIDSMDSGNQDKSLQQKYLPIAASVLCGIFYVGFAIAVVIRLPSII